MRTITVTRWKGEKYCRTALVTEGTPLQIQDVHEHRGKTNNAEK